MAMSYHIEEADLSTEADAVRSLWVSNLQGHDLASATAKLRLGYAENPAGPGSVILLYADGEPLPKGVQGLHPRTFHLGGKAIKAAALADFAVDPQHRSLGPALLLARAGASLCSQRFDFAYGFPNLKAAPVIARSGLNRVGTISRYAKVLASRDKLSQFMPQWLSALCAPAADWLLALHDVLRTVAAGHRVEISGSNWSAPELDELWASRPDGLLLSDRSGSMLKWRFDRRSLSEWRVCVAKDRRGSPKGYVVWRLHDGFAQVGDFFCPNGEGWTTSVLLSFARYARTFRARSVSVLFFGSSKVEASLKASGLRARAPGAPIFAMLGRLKTMDPRQSWYLTQFDNDAD